MVPSPLPSSGTPPHWSAKAVAKSVAKRADRKAPAKLGLAAAALGALLFGGCLAAPPPIVVATPFGEVRAESEEEASEVAELLERLAPRVQEILPGSQRRPIDVWVQEKLRVYRHRTRPESVRGFTLLADEFEARRIHLQGESTQSSWYLSHELVHALIGTSWKTLPGVMEEGLGDVVAEILNPGFADHIRAHRLLNTSLLTGGFALGFSYGVPEEIATPRHWKRQEMQVTVRPLEASDPFDVRDLLATSRSNLHRRWPEIPETLYGFSWLVTSRIVERHGLDGLHDLCLRAADEGYELVPVAWLEDAAEMNFDELDPDFLGSCFGRREVIAATWLQPDLFTDPALDRMRAAQPVYRRGTLGRMNPAFHLDDGSSVPLRALRPLTYSVYTAWKNDARAIPAVASKR